MWGFLHCTLSVNCSLEVKDLNGIEMKLVSSVPLCFCISEKLRIWALLKGVFHVLFSDQVYDYELNMEIDIPGDLEADSEVEDTLTNGLKRSSSAPLIPQLIASDPPAHKRLRASYVTRSWRRWSTSVSPVSPSGGGGGGQTGWARLNRLKVEETRDVGKNEIATEREVQREISMEKNLSQSWEDLSLSDNKETRGRRKTTDPTIPLTIGVGPFPSPRTSPSPSPSPTRSSVTGKQCYSPSMQMPVPTNLSFTPSPSSSPTRRSWTSRRSLSPITLRPSALGPVKRKCMLDDGECTPSKRQSSNLLITQSTRSAPYKVPWSSSWSTPQPSPHPPSETSRENSPVPAVLTPEQAREEDKMETKETQV